MSRHGRHIYNNSSRVSEKADEGDRRFSKYIGYGGLHDHKKSHDMRYYDSNIDINNNNNNNESNIDTYIPFTKDIDYLSRHENNYYNKKYPSTTPRRSTTITTYYDGYDNHSQPQPQPHNHKQPFGIKSRDNNYNRKKTQEKMDQISRNSKNIMKNDKYDHKKKDKYKKSTDKFKPVEAQSPLPLLPLPLIIPLKSTTINNTKKPTYKSNIKISGDYSGDEKDFYFIPFKEPTPSSIPLPTPTTNVLNMDGIIDNQTKSKEKDIITKDDDSDIEIVEIFDKNKDIEYNTCACGDYSTCSEDECYINHI